MKVHLLISNELALQKLRKSPDKSMIQKLQQMYDKDAISIYDFIDTGRIMPIAYYKKEFGEIQLDDKCENVCRYMGGIVIQNLNSGDWFYSNLPYTMGILSTNLKEVEQFIWDKVINN